METPASQDTGSSGPRASRPLIVPPTTEVASSPSAPPTSLSVVPRASQGSPSAPPTSLSIVPPGEDEVSPGPIIYHTPRYALPPEGRRESLILDEEQGAIPVGPPVRTSSDPYAGTASKAAQSLSATNIPTPSHRMPASPRKVAPVTPDGGTVMTVPGVDLSMPGLGLAESPNRPVSEAASPPNQPLDIEDAPMGLLSDDTQRVRKKPMSYRGMFYAILALSVGVVIIGLSAGVAKNKQLLDAAQKVQGNDNGNNPPIANPPTEDMGGNFDVAVSSEDFQGTYVKLMEDNFENVEAIHHSRLCTEKGCMRLEMEMDHNNDDYETGSTIVVSGKRDLKDARQKTLKVNKVTKVKGPQDKKADPPPPDGGMGDGGMGGMRRAMQAVSQTRTAVVLIVNWIGSPSIDKALLTWQAWQALLGPSNSVKDMLKYCTWDQYKMNFDVSTKAGDYANDTTLDFYWVDVPTKCTSNTFPCPAVYDVDTCTTGNYDGDYETVQYAMNVLGLTRSTWQHVIMVHPSRTCWPSAGLGTLGCSGAFCNTWISTDSVEWPSIHLHELGHNFGLEHAGIVGDEYGDRTAVMGRAYGSSYPCFHAPHAAQLGIITPIALSATNFCPGANYVLDIQSMSETPTNSAIKITPDWTTDTFSYFVQFKTATKYDGTITLTNADFSPTLAPLAIKKHSVASTTFGIHMTKLTAGTAWTGIAADPTLSVLLQSSTLAPNLAATVAPYGTSVANLKLVRGSCTVGYYGNTYTITSTSTSIPTNCQGASPAPCLPNQCLWGTLPATTGVNGVICPQNTPGVSQSISCMLGYQFNSSATSISEVCKACTSCPTCDASCSDGAKSLRELGVDCGGTTCTKACDTSGYQTVTEPDYYTCVDVTGSALTFHNTRWTYVEMLRGYPAYQSSGRPTTACTNGICYMNVATGKSYYKMTTGKDDTSYWCGYSTGASARNSNRPLDVTKHTSWQYPDSTCTWIQDTGVKIRPCECSNGIKDSFEQGVDCGGPCAPCTSSCSDAKRSGLETDVDCGGGTCTACGEWKGCLATSDCATGLTCSECGMCVTSNWNGVAPSSSPTASPSPSVTPSRSVCPTCPTCDASCSDGAKSQGELGVDCGGTTCTKACDATGYQTVTEPDYYTCVDVTGSALTMHNTRWTYIEMLYGYPAYQRSQPECPNGICHMNVPAGSYYKMTRGINDTRAYCGWTTIAGARNSARPLDVTKHTSWQYPNSTCKWNQDTGVTIRPCQCSNGIKDSFEQGVDCGGPCAPCTTSCSDAKRTGLETDVDCGGGTCTACGEGKGCLATSDCTAGMTCNSCGMCVGPGSSYQLFSNTYLNAGGDLAIESMTSLADAGARCNSLSGCLGFTFVVGAWPTNVWFKNHTIRGTSPEWTTYIKKFASSSLSPSRSPAATGRRRQA